MKRLGISQRVEIVPAYGERRDCLDQRWTDFCLELNYVPVPLPMVNPARAAALLDAMRLDGLLLSGGNSIACLNPAASDASPERDAFEFALLDQADTRSMPVVGVCRGMQMINIHQGGQLVPISGHVAARHTLCLEAGGQYQFPAVVNSYHNWGISKASLASELSCLAYDAEGHVEAFELAGQRVLGIMWHPEREQPFSSLDIQLIKRFLK